MFVSIRTHSDAYGQPKNYRFEANGFELKPIGTKIEIKSRGEETKSSGARGGLCHIVNKDLVIEIDKDEIEKIIDFCIEHQIVKLRCQSNK